MATTIVKHQYDGFLISQRPDGFVNLTQMAKPYDKRVSDYLVLPSTQSYIKDLAEDFDKLPENLVVSLEGRNGGTWAHLEIAIDFAQWLDNKFRIWANRTLRQVITQPTNFGRILDVAVPGSPIFEARFEKEVARVTGWHKNDIKNGKFYWEFVYYWLTPAEREKLDLINPPMSNGRRRLRIHDCLDAETKARLAPFQLELLGRLKSCKDGGIAELRRMIQRELGCGGQLNIFDGLGL